MNSNRLEQLFLRAIELSDPAVQRQFVETEAAGDIALRTELMQLLEYHAESDASGFLEVPLLRQDPSLALVGEGAACINDDACDLEHLLGPTTSVTRKVSE